MNMSNWIHWSQVKWKSIHSALKRWRPNSKYDFLFIFNCSVRFLFQSSRFLFFFQKKMATIILQDRDQTIEGLRKMLTDVQAELTDKEQVIAKLEGRDEIEEENGRDDDVSDTDASPVESKYREKNEMSHFRREASTVKNGQYSEYTRREKLNRRVNVQKLYSKWDPSNRTCAPTRIHRIGFPYHFFGANQRKVDVKIRDVIETFWRTTMRELYDKTWIEIHILGDPFHSLPSTRENGEITHTAGNTR